MVGDDRVDSGSEVSDLNWDRVVAVEDSREYLQMTSFDYSWVLREVNGAVRVDWECSCFQESRGM